MAHEQKGTYRPAQPPPFIGDCEKAKELGFYEFLLHLTQGLQRYPDHWCPSCIKVAEIWWALSQHAKALDPTQYAEAIAVVGSRIEEHQTRRQADRRRRQERSAWREHEQHRPHNPRSDQQNDPKPEQAKKENKEKEKKEEPAASVATEQQLVQDELNFLQTTGKILGGFARWVATGKFE